jgi:hypothetical protein
MKRYLINVLASQDLNEIADYFTTNIKSSKPGVVCFILKNQIRL